MMSALEELTDIKNRLDILAINIADIISYINRDSISETRKAYCDFLEATHGDDVTDFELDVRSLVMSNLESIMYWKK